MKRVNVADESRGITKERMRDENSPNVSNYSDDCIGKQLFGWMPVVAAAGAAHATGFAPTAAATADPSAREIDSRQIKSYYVTSVS